MAHVYVQVKTKMDTKKTTYKYDIDLIVDEIIKDAEIIDTFESHRFSTKNNIQQEIDDIVNFIKKRNSTLKLKGHNIDIKDFAKDIFSKFQQ